MLSVYEIVYRDFMNVLGVVRMRISNVVSRFCLQIDRFEPENLTEGMM